MPIEAISTLDLRDFIDGTEGQKGDFVQNLGEAFEYIGFVSIENHGYREVDRNRLYAAVQEFFRLEDEVKSSYEVLELFGQRGYVGKRKEHAKGRTTGDLKEFYHIGQELHSGHELKEVYPENIWPNEVPEFRNTTIEAFTALQDTGVVYF